MRLVLTVCAVLTASPATAQEFLANRSDWVRMQPNTRMGYAMGAWDGLNAHFTTDDKEDAAFKLGRAACAKELKLDSNEMTKLIDNAYQNDVSRWASPPWAILIQELHKACKTYVDAEFAKAGLKRSD